MGGWHTVERTNTIPRYSHETLTYTTAVTRWGEKEGDGGHPKGRYWELLNDAAVHRHDDRVPKGSPLSMRQTTLPSNEFCDHQCPLILQRLF